MYVGRTMEQLQNIPYGKWTFEELAYHQDTLSHFGHYLNEEGQTLFCKVQEEIQSRGGMPNYGGDYDHPSSVIYD
jgi:hypothetical protein